MKDFLDELDNELNNKIIPIQKKPEVTNLKENIVTNKLVEKKPHIQHNKKEIDNDEIKNEFEFKVDNTRLFDGNKFASRFPETKFYLPTLRDGYTRYIPIGGNDETGAKNMGMVQYKEEIVLIDCGVQFADEDMLGANYSIPDVSFLTKYTKNIKGFLITHAHLDHIGALKHILPAIGFPIVYGTKLTIGIIKKSLEEAGILNKTTFIEVDAGSNKKLDVGCFKVEFFRVNHSIPDCAGIYIESPGGAKFVHTGDFKIDFTPAIDEPADLSRIGEIGRRGITLLMSDSTGSTRKGFCKSEKEVGETLERIVKAHNKGRLIIATFSSWLSRVQQLIDICDRNGKHIFLSGRSMIENVAIAKELGYLNVKQGIVKKMSPKATEGILPHNQIIITTGSQGEQFSALSRMAEGRHNALEIIHGDTVVFSSSIVPGNEKSVVGVINKLIKLGAKVITKDDGEVHTGGHAFQEEQKIMLNLVNPKYFMPVYGDIYYRNIHKNTALSTGYKEDNVLLLDNGNIVDFAPDSSVFRSKIKVPVQEIIIDGHGIGLANSHVMKAREMMMNSGVLIVLYKVDKKTRAILGHIKLETRGLVYLDEVRHIHRMVIKKSKDVYENTIKDVPDIEEKELVKLIKSDLEAFLLKRIDREPMIVPMIMEV